MQKITFALHSTKSGRSIICMQSASRLTFYMATKQPESLLNSEMTQERSKPRLARGGVLNKYQFVLCLDAFTQDSNHIFRTGGYQM